MPSALFQQLSAPPDCLSLLNENERRKIREWNDTRQAYPQELCVHDLVELRAAADPHSAAVSTEEGTLSYGELNAQANRVARRLADLGAGRNVPIGVCLDRSAACVVGALAVLKTGSYYIPLDPAYPPARLALMLSKSQAPVLVTRKKFISVLLERPGRTAILDVDDEIVSRQGARPHGPKSHPDDPAYLIFTSGSTGEPKGVEIAHSSLLNLVHWHQREFQVIPGDRAAQLAGLGFDAAVWELWPYLSLGASVHFPDEATRHTAELLRDWLVEQRITIAFAPTALAERLIELEWPARTALRTLLTGADALRRYPPPGLPFRFVNNYGPTECTVVATSGTVDPCERPEHPPTIGRPIANTQIYILNERFEHVPVGEAGEIWVGGVGVARGYIGQPCLTAERFFPNPFVDEPEARIYRTGDRGRYLSDGQIEFIGRIDDQIKIRDQRIEPGEVVSVLEQHPGVRAAFVTTREDRTGEKRLVAYLAAERGTRLDRGELQERLRKILPDYMVPVTFVGLPALPLTPNGKVDRAGLPPPDESNTIGRAISSSPRSKVEERVSEIVAVLLELPTVGTEDNFFLLGGHSLLGTQMIARVREAFGVELPLRALFDSPTVAGLSAEVERLLLAKLEAMSEEEAERLVRDSAGQPTREGLR